MLTHVLEKLSCHVGRGWRVCIGSSVFEIKALYIYVIVAEISPPPTPSDPRARETLEPMSAQLYS